MELYKKNKFQQSSQEIPYYGFTKSSYWVSFQLKSISGGQYYLTMEIPLYLYNESTFIKKISNEQLFIGIYFGIFFILIFTNYTLQLGSVFHVIVLTIGLAKTIYSIQQDKQSAKGEAELLKQRFHSMIEKSNDIIFILNKELIITYINSAVKKNF